MPWKTLLGFVLAFGLGAGARLLDVPVPAPHRLLGALLVLAITLGYVSADRWIDSRAARAVVESDAGDVDAGGRDGR